MMNKPLITPPPSETLTTNWSHQELRVASHLLGLVAEQRNGLDPLTHLSPENAELYTLATNPDVTSRQLNEAVAARPEKKGLHTLFDQLTEIADFPNHKRESILQGLQILAGMAIRSSQEVDASTSHPTSFVLVKQLVGMLDALNGARHVVQAAEKLIPTTVGKYLQSILDERGIKHAELAQMAGVSLSSIQRFVTGAVRPPERYTLLPILHALKLDQETIHDIQYRYYLERQEHGNRPRRKPCTPRDSYS